MLLSVWLRSHTTELVFVSLVGAEILQRKMRSCVTNPVRRELQRVTGDRSLTACTSLLRNNLSRACELVAAFFLRQNTFDSPIFVSRVRDRNVLRDGATGLSVKVQRSSGVRRRSSTLNLVDPSIHGTGQSHCARVDARLSGMKAEGQFPGATTLAVAFTCFGSFLLPRSWSFATGVDNHVFVALVEDRGQSYRVLYRLSRRAQLALLARALVQPQASLLHQLIFVRQQNLLFLFLLSFHGHLNHFDRTGL
mmetsp:Transcript_46703/g.101531  ORF Transcript_46703/g.101531 Transcript_46703/m.101531 type:complete len:251 (+) Transcript_46703:2032-2784(+)